jgi:hypothetical protein
MASPTFPINSLPHPLLQVEMGDQNNPITISDDEEEVQSIPLGTLSIVDQRFQKK